MKKGRKYNKLNELEKDRGLMTIYENEKRGSSVAAGGRDSNQHNNQSILINSHVPNGPTSNNAHPLVSSSMLATNNHPPASNVNLNVNLSVNFPAFQANQTARGVINCNNNNNNPCSFQYDQHIGSNSKRHNWPSYQNSPTGQLSGQPYHLKNHIHQASVIVNDRQYNREGYLIRNEGPKFDTDRYDTQKNQLRRYGDGINRGGDSNHHNSSQNNLMIPSHSMLHSASIFPSNSNQIQFSDVSNPYFRGQGREMDSNVINGSTINDNSHAPFTSRSMSQFNMDFYQRSMGLEAERGDIVKAGGAGTKADIEGRKVLDRDHQKIGPSLGCMADKSNSQNANHSVVNSNIQHKSHNGDEISFGQPHFGANSKKRLINTPQQKQNQESQKKQYQQDLSQHQSQSDNNASQVQSQQSCSDGRNQSPQSQHFDEQSQKRSPNPENIEVYDQMDARSVFLIGGQRIGVLERPASSVKCANVVGDNVGWPQKKAVLLANKQINFGFGLSSNVNSGNLINNNNHNNNSHKGLCEQSVQPIARCLTPAHPLCLPSSPPTIISPTYRSLPPTHQLIQLRSAIEQQIEGEHDMNKHKDSQEAKSIDLCHHASQIKSKLDDQLLPTPAACAPESNATGSPNYQQLLKERTVKTIIVKKKSNK